MLKNHQNYQYPRIFLLGCLTVCLGTFSAHAAHAQEARPVVVALGEDEQDFMLTGRCPDGATYRLHAYQKSVNGVRLPFYDYQGPAGTGTVKTGIAAKVMAARVCRELADIVDDPRLD